MGTRTWGYPLPCPLPCAFRFQWWLVPMPFGLLIFVYDELRKLGVRCCPGSEWGDWGWEAENVPTAAALTFDFQHLTSKSSHH